MYVLVSFLCSYEDFSNHLKYSGFSSSDPGDSSKNDNVLEFGFAFTDLPLPLIASLSDSEPEVGPFSSEFEASESSEGTSLATLLALDLFFDPLALPFPLRFGLDFLPVSMPSSEILVGGFKGAGTWEAS